MKSIPVKDLGTALMNLQPAQTARKPENGEFRKLWDNQKNNEAQDSQNAERKQNPALARRAESSRVRQDDYERVKKDGELCGEKTAEELSPEDLEHAMELLGQTALELMQRLADAFGVTVEELQAVMGAMDLEPVDLLDASVLGNLMLQLGGAQDVSALVTDETLYENYREIMDQLQRMLQENGEELNADPKTLVQLLEKSAEEEQPAMMNGGLAAEKPADKTQDFAPAGTDDSGIVSEEMPDTVLKTGNESETGSQNGEQTGGDGGKAEHKADSSEHANILIQNIRSEQFQPNVQHADAAAENSPWTTETRNIMDQIMNYMKIQLSPDTTSLEMQLHPASLGTLQVQIASKGGIVTANFITQNEAVKAALESQMVQLRESFEEQGVKVEAIEVTVQSHEFERNLEQGRGRHQQEPDRKNRGRRVRMTDVSAADVLQEDTALSGEMSRLDGSTVDYAV